MEKQNNRAYKLLKKWVDGQLNYRLSDIGNPRLRGGLVCPACGLVHGRCYDLVFPLCYLYKYEKDERYLEAADSLIDFANESLIDADGLYVNDFNGPWFGVAAFAADAFYETLETAGDALPEKLRTRLHGEFLKLSEAVRLRFMKEGFYPNINYFAAATALMAEAYKDTGEEKYKEASYIFKKKVTDFITEDNMLFGEAFSGRDVKTPKGYRGVDLGYNMDETFTFLLKAGKLLGDAETFETGKKLILEGLNFMLPDGGLDNSWGSRSAKWTYYGSRTSDGMGCALALLPDEPICAEAACRNLEILEKCTDDEGILSGGLWYNEEEEPACLHHGFSHAKALVALAESGIDLSRKHRLPMDDFEGIKSYESCGTYIISRGDIYSSFSASDIVYNGIRDLVPTGGVLSCAFSRKLGSPIIAATQNTGHQVEPKNMQLPKIPTWDVPSMTPSIECDDYFSNYAKDFETALDKESYEFSTKGFLESRAGDKGGEYELKYSVLPDGIEISARSEKGGKYVLPLVLKKSESAGIGEYNSLILLREGGTVEMSSSGEISVDLGAREFNPCGGFTYIVPEITLPAGEKVTVKIKVT